MRRILQGLSAVVDVSQLAAAMDSGSVNPNYVTNLMWQPPYMNTPDVVPALYVVDDNTASQMASLLGGSMVKAPIDRLGPSTNLPSVPYINLGNGRVLAADVAGVIKPPGCNSCPGIPVSGETSRAQMLINALSALDPSDSFVASGGTGLVTPPGATYQPPPSSTAAPPTIIPTPAPVDTGRAYIPPSTPPVSTAPPVQTYVPPQQQASGSQVLNTGSQQTTTTSDLTSIFTGSDFFGLPNWVWFAGGAALLFVFVGGKRK